MKKNDALSLINDAVRGLKAYHLEPTDCAVKLNQNENPNDLPPALKKQAAEFFTARPWNRYPNFIPEYLKTALAQYAGVGASNVIVGNGSNEMLLVLLLAFAGKAKSAIICPPTFTVYKLLCDGLNTKTVSVSLNDDLQYDVCAIQEAAANNPGAMLILCSPNNPVGNSISENDLRKILDAHTGICVLDQAYIEFGGYNAIKLLSEYSNLIITRTFSKAMCAAGLRLGYMLGDKDLIAEINKIKLPYNINFFSEHAATLILQDTSNINKTVAEIVGERDILFNFFKTLPLDNVYQSDANFILIRTRAKDNLFKHLCDSGILVRDVSSYPKLENCLRITVGTSDENIKLKESMSKFFN